MKYRTRTKRLIGRSEPDLPKILPELEDAGVLFGGQEIDVSECTISDLRVASVSASSLFFESCVLDRVGLPGSKFAAIRLKDARLIGCDLSNVETRMLKATRVEFINCRMTGLRVLHSECQDVLISGGDQRYTQFASSRFKCAEFDSCNFEEADFQGADLRGSIFRKCTLRNAEMGGAKLEDADLRGSSVEGLRLDAGDIYGAIVDPSQAMIFASLLGLQIM